MSPVTVECVECGGEVTFEDTPLVGEIVSCPDCGVELEVINDNPVEIDVAPEVEEDWGE